MSMTLEYAAGKAARTVKLAQAYQLREAIEELAIGVAYLADYLRQVDLRHQSNGAEPKGDG